MKQSAPRFESASNTGGANPPESNQEQYDPKTHYSILRNGERIEFEDPNKKDTVLSSDNVIISRAIHTFLKDHGVLEDIPTRPTPAVSTLSQPGRSRFSLTWIRRPFVVAQQRSQAPPQPTRSSQPASAQEAPSPSWPPTVRLVPTTRTRDIVKSRIFIGGTLTAFLLGGIAGYYARDNNLFAFGMGNTHFNTQTITPGECVNSPGGSIAVGKSSINGITLFSKDPSIEMLARLNSPAQVCATGGEPVTLQYLEGNSQLMDIVQQQDASLLQQTGCNGRRCNEVTQIHYPYP